MAGSALAQCLRRAAGLIAHVFKAAGSYHTAIGVLLGASYRWNSGAYSSRTYSDFGRNLPLPVPAEEAYEFNGATDTWIQPGVIGSLPNPEWGQLDLRAEYKKAFGGLGTEFFVDIFNVANNQGAIRIQDFVAGSGGTDFMEPTRFLESASLLPWGPVVVLIRRRTRGFVGRLSSGAGPFLCSVEALLRGRKPPPRGETHSDPEESDLGLTWV